VDLAREDQGYPGWVLATVALIVGMFMSILDTSIVNIAIPRIETAFGASTAEVEWVVTVYLLALGVSAPASGWLADRLGYKRLYLAAMGVFTLGSLFAAIAPSLPLLVGARVIQAVGGGILPVTTTALLFRIVPRRSLGVANGFRGIALMIAPVLGPVLGGYLVQAGDWRWIFTINIPIGIFGILLAASAVPEVWSRQSSRFDLPGFLTASLGLGALLFAVSEGQSYGWSSPAIVGLLYFAAVLLVLFVWIELRSPDPMIDLRVLRLTTFSASVVYSVLLNVALFSGVFFIPIFLQLIRGETAIRAGLVLVPGGIATAIIMPIAGRLYDRYDAKVLVVVGTLILAGSTWLFSGLTLATPDATIALWSGIRGIGMGFAMMPTLTAGMSVVPRLGLSRAAAMRNVVQRASGAFGIAGITVVLDSFIAQHASDLAARVSAGSIRAQALLQLPGAVSRPGVLTATMAKEVAGRIHQAAFAQSLAQIFGYLAFVALLGVIPALMLKGDRGQAPAPAGTQSETAVAD
jgi:EmrB/QacA subfamily drug resistance transporter